MKTRRIVSALLTIAVILSTFVFGVSSVSAEELPSYYVDQTNGADSNPGTKEAPLKTISAAGDKMYATGGTVYVLGEYFIGDSTSESSFPKTLGRLVIEGGDDSAKINTKQSCGFYLSGETEFRNINLSVGLYGHGNTKGNTIILGEGVTTGAMIHVGPINGGTTSSEHVIIDGGNYTSGSMTIGGAYLRGRSEGIEGDAFIDVLNGSLAKLNIAQDGWNDGHGPVTIGGSVKVKVGSKGSISAMSNSGRYANVKGYLHVIVEDGGKMCAYALDNFDHKDVYRVNVDPAHGTVNNVAGTGLFEFAPEEGYLARVEMPNGTVRYVGNVKLQLPLGTSRVTFTNEKKLAAQKVDVTIVPATPGSTEFPVLVDSDTYQATVIAKTPDHSTVGYAVAYTYTVELKPAGDYVFPAGFEFTINGSSDYKLYGYEETTDGATFVYRLGETERDNTRPMIAYDGGIGVIGEAPLKEFVDAGTEITVGEQYFKQGGYAFKGYRVNDTDVIVQPGDKFIVNEDVTFHVVWEKLPYIMVVFNDGGATGGDAPASLGAYEGEYVTLPENTFAMIGHDFSAWEDGNGTKYQPGELFRIPAENVTMTAVWKEKTDAGKIIYVDVINGAPTNDGLTAETAVNSIAKAYALAGDGDLTIVAVGALNLQGDLPVKAGHLTITASDNNASITLPKDLTLQSDVTIENIKINATRGAYIVTGGNTVVLGPNLENIGDEYDVYDGGNGYSVEKIDTTINPGVSIRNYYFAGANHDNTKTIPGNGLLTVNGGSIGTLDLAPMGSGSIAFDGYVAFYINGGEIGTITASNSLNGAVAEFLIYGNGTIPASFSESLMNKMIASADSAYILDSGVGGKTTVNEAAVAQGIVTPVSNVGGLKYFRNPSNGMYTAIRTATQRLINLQSNPTDASQKYVINSIRFGRQNTTAIAITVEKPTGGAEAFSIKPETTSKTAKVQMEGWEPELKGGKFAYETIYTAKVRITPNSGVLFLEGKLPTVTINGQKATVTTNRDGSLSASVAFTEQTGYAPKLKVTFEAGTDQVTTGVPEAREWEHMTGNKLPDGIAMDYLGYRFIGWQCSADGKVYGAGETYYMTSNFDVVFTAVWQMRGSWDLPNVIILYDMTMYANDTGRNPKFESSDSPILLENAFNTLEKPIGGSSSVKTTEFDHEKVWVLASDGSENQMMFNNYTMDKFKIDVKTYPHVTMVYYYDSKSGAAIGDNGYLTYGNVLQADGKVSSWYGKGVSAKDKVVAGKWATMTFDLTEAIASANTPDGAVYRQFHMFPIGTKKLSELKGDTLYLKAMYFSKQPTVK